MRSVKMSVSFARCRRAAVMARALVVLVAFAFIAGCAGSVKRRLFYPSGKVRWEVETRSGIPDGRSVTWHENGRVASRGTYANGKKHGVFVYYDESGNRTREAYYENNDEVDEARARELGFALNEPDPVAPASGSEPVAGGAAGVPGSEPGAGVAGGASGAAVAPGAASPPASYIQPVQTGVGVFSPGLDIAGLHVVHWHNRAGVSGAVALSRQSLSPVSASLTSLSIAGSVLGTVYQSGNARLAAGARVGFRYLVVSGDDVPESVSAKQFQLAAPLRAEVLLAKNFAVHCEAALVLTFSSEDDPGLGVGDGTTIELNSGGDFLGNVGFTIYF